MSTHSVLVVGVGSIGERHLRCFQATHRATLSICEVNAPLRRTIAERYSLPGVFESLDSALHARPDAVVICTPAHTHIPIALQAARADAHLLIEKPLSTSLNGITDLEVEIARRGLVASVAYIHRSNPVLTAMRQALQSGRFGEPLEIIAVSGQYFPFFRPAYRQTYYVDRAMGGGAIQDALTHIINAVEWLVGPVDSLVADAAHLALEGVEVEDTVHVLARHGRILASYSLNQHQAPNEGFITVVCTKGTARFEVHNSRWRWMVEPGAAWHDEPSKTLERDTVFTLQANAFLDAIEGTRPPLCTVQEAGQTLRSNLAIMTSSENRTWKNIDEISDPANL